MTHQLKQEFNMTHEEFVQALRDSLEYCEAADDAGSIDFEMSRWQEEVNSWPPILDEFGGI